MRILRSLVLLLLLPLLPAFPQGTSSPTADKSATETPGGSAEQTVPKDTRKNWSVAFTALISETLPPEDAYLAFSIPLLLKDQVGALASHTFQTEELLAYRKKVVGHELRSLYQGLAQLRRERDETLFTAPPANPKTLTALEDRIKTILERIHWIEALDPALIDISKDKPVFFKEGSGVANLFDPPRYSPSQFAAQQDVDLLIGGSVSEVQGYVLIDLWAYAAAREQMVFDFHEAAAREQLYASLAEAVKDLTGIILGTQWALLSVVADPTRSTTFVDGESLGSGHIQSLYIEPGIHELRVTAPGYAPQTREVELTALEEQTISITLVKETRPQAKILSDPPDADVYVDSVWTGKTPLSLELPAERSKVELDMAGFYPLPFSIGPTSNTELSLHMQKDVGSRDAMQKKARDDFYLALGFFAVSIPIPVLCWSYTNDFSSEYFRLPEGSTAAQNTLNLVNSFYAGYVTGLGVCVSLFTWTIVQLIRYISSADRTAG